MGKITISLKKLWFQKVSPWNNPVTDLDGKAESQKIRLFFALQTELKAQG